MLLSLLSIIKLIAFNLPILADPMPLLRRVLRVLMLILVSNGAVHVVLVWPLVVPILCVVIHAFLPVLRVAAIIAILVTP
jgi:hypothetical protein